MKILNFKLKIIFLFFFFLLSTFYFLSPAFAESSAGKSAYVALPTTTPTKPNAAAVPSSTNPDVPNNLHNWTQGVMIEVMSSLSCQLAGTDPINPTQSCLGVDQENGKIGFLPSPQTGGAIGFMGNMISALYTPPLHTVDYFKDLASNFGISKKTYAQTAGGTGFQSLTPLISVWAAFRNIVYLVLVIIFVAIGLAIMLRFKIDPRTVMSIQNQIPKIIVGILAVTFSFAIAGFLIDMMWVITYLIYGIFSGITVIDIQSLNPSIMQGKTAVEAAGLIKTGGVFGISNNVAGSMTQIIQNFLGIDGSIAMSFNPLVGIWDAFDPSRRTVFNWLFDVISYASGLTVFFKWAAINTSISSTPLIGDIINGITAAGKTAAAVGFGYATFVGTELFLRNALPHLIVFLIILVALFSALIRLWFALLMAYVEILLAVVLAPFWIIGGIVPGSPISLGGWLKNMAANLLAFPVTIAMFMFGKVFVDSFGTQQVNGQFVPPLIGNPTATNTIGSLIGLGIILMTPNVVNILKQMLKAPKTDTGIGKSIAGSTGVVTGTGKSMAGATGVAIMGDPYNPTKKGFGAIMSGWLRRNG